MSAPKLTEPQRALLRAMASGGELTAERSGGYPVLISSEWVPPRQPTIAACERRGWIKRGRKEPTRGLFYRFSYEITDSGRRALAEGGEG